MMAGRYDLSAFLRESKNDPIRVAGRVRLYIEAELRRRSAKDGALLLKYLHQILSQLIDSTDPAERLSGVYIIDELIDLPIDKVRKVPSFEIILANFPVIGAYLRFFANAVAM